jgi:uncharacterized membrane protein YwzB
MKINNQILKVLIILISTVFCTGVVIYCFTKAVPNTPTGYSMIMFGSSVTGAVCIGYAFAQFIIDFVKYIKNL